MTTPPGGSARHVFHLIANSHLDPVWLWDWREGLTEGLITIRTILGLMDEYPELTYNRGESLIYEQVERRDPAAFRRIGEFVKTGRWDYVGGSYLQPDTNLTATETMARQYCYGQRYFASRFGRPARVAWAADSFGHSRGLPAILVGAGFRYFAFTRVVDTALALDSPGFWWTGPDGSRVLAYRPNASYGNERFNMTSELDRYLAEAQRHPWRNVAVFYGLGNHGGGPTRRHLREIDEWREAHPEVEVRHSGMHRFFEAFEKEAGAALPVLDDELNFIHRGVYATAAKFKFRYRKAETGLLRAERSSSAISAGLGLPPANLEESWRDLLFNSFHDILPGTSMERAMDEQISWIEGLIHKNAKTEFGALGALVSRINIPVSAHIGDQPGPVAILAWNSHPREYRGPLEIEVTLDYRPIWSYENRVSELPLELRDAQGRAIPFQVISAEHRFMPNLPWRARVVLDARLPALGWAVYTLGWVEGAEKVPYDFAPAIEIEPGTIANEHYRLSAAKGGLGVQIHRGKTPIFSGEGLGLQTLRDPWGAWGNHYAHETEAEDISDVLETWTITDTGVLERGPLRAKLWARFEDGRSRADLIFSLHHGRGAVDVDARVFWDRPGARLKLVMPGAGDEVEYQVPGGTIRRGPMKEVPGGRWARTVDGPAPFGFASDALYGYDLKGTTLRATILRSGRYAADTAESAETPKFLPVIDGGEYRFRFLLTAEVAALPRLAEELEAPPITVLAPPGAGDLPRSGGFAEIGNPNVAMLAFKPAEDGKDWILRLQELDGTGTSPVFIWKGKTLGLPEMAPFSIRTYRLAGGGVEATPVSIFEEAVPGAEN